MSKISNGILQRKLSHMTLTNPSVECFRGREPGETVLYSNIWRIYSSIFVYDGIVVD